MIRSFRSITQAIAALALPSSVASPQPDYALVGLDFDEHVGPVRLRDPLIERHAEDAHVGDAQFRSHIPKRGGARRLVFRGNDLRRAAAIVQRRRIRAPPLREPRSTRRRRPALSAVRRRFISAPRSQASSAFSFTSNPRPGRFSKRKETFVAGLFESRGDLGAHGGVAIGSRHGNLLRVRVDQRRIQMNPGHRPDRPSIVERRDPHIVRLRQRRHALDFASDCSAPGPAARCSPTRWPADSGSPR